MIPCFEMGLILPLLIFALTMKASGEDDSTRIYNKQPWKEAFDQCKRKGDGFTFPLTGPSNDGGIQGLPTWLPIRRIRYPTWTWLDNEVVDSDFEKQNWDETMNCGAVHIRDGMLETEECSRPNLGTLCSSKDEKQCKANHGGSCSTIRNHTFYFECDVANWYQARYRCQQLDMTLAVVKSEAMVRALGTLYKSSDNTCNRVWVGLRREDWLYESSVSRDKTKFKMSWASGQPSSDGNCAVSMGKSGGGSYWQSVFCGAIHHWLCKRDTLAHTVTMMSVTGTKEAWSSLITEVGSQQNQRTANTTDTPENKSSITNVIVVAVLSVLLFALGFGLIILLCRRTHRKKYTSEEKGTREEEENLDIESQVLEAKELLRPDLRITKTLTSKGDRISSPLSDITFDVPGKSLREREKQQVRIKIYSDMKGERYNLPSEQFMVCPVVEVSGFNNTRIRGTLTLEHSLQNIQAIKVLRSEKHPNGQFSWKLVKRKVYKIDSETIKITTKFNVSAYTCTLMKSIDDRDYTELSLAIFLDYVQTESGFQDLFTYLYMIKTCHNLTDYLQHIHNKKGGVQKVVEFKESYTCLSLTDTDKFYVSLEPGDIGWQEIAKPKTEEPKFEKVWVLDRNTDYLNQPAGYKIAEYHLRHDKGEQPVKEIIYGVDIDVVYINASDRYHILSHSDTLHYEIA